MSGQQTIENQSINNRENAVLVVNLRDYFAAAALQGLLSSIEPNQLWCGEDVAVTCYRTADTMLKAREAK